MAVTNTAAQMAAAARKQVHVVAQNTLLLCANCGHKEDVPSTEAVGQVWTKAPDDYHCPVCGATQASDLAAKADAEEPVR